MKRTSIAAFCLAMLFCCGTALGQSKPGGKIVGIMPVFDTSGDPFGQIFAENMTAMIYQKLADAPFQVLLMNPGGLYSPLIPESLTDYAQAAGVDLVLITTLQPTDKPQKGDYILHVEAKLMDVQTSKEMTPSTYSKAVSRHDALMDVLGAGSEYSANRSGTMQAGRSLFMSMAGGNKPFAKQPLGKAANEMADSVHSQMLAQVPATKGDVPQPKSGTCTISIGVKYISKKASSNAYSVIVNGEDQSLVTKGGITKLENFKSGPVFVQISVADTPYRLPAQDLYQANTVLDCAAPEHNLLLEIGPVGDALLHWRQ